MNKRSLIKFILVLINMIATLLVIKAEISFTDPLTILLFSLVPITLVMFYYRKSFKNYKKFQFAYDVILMILILASLIFVLYFAFTVLNFSTNIIEAEYSGLYFFTYIVVLMTLLLFSFFDIFKKTNKKNDILVIIICLVTILMSLRVYMIPGFNQDIFVYYTLSNNIYSYVSEFYVYFFILNVLAIIHYYINKV